MRPSIADENRSARACRMTCNASAPKSKNARTIASPRPAGCKPDKNEADTSLSWQRYLTGETMEIPLCTRPGPLLNGISSEQGYSRDEWKGRRDSCRPAGPENVPGNRDYPRGGRRTSTDDQPGGGEPFSLGCSRPRHPAPMLLSWRLVRFVVQPLRRTRDPETRNRCARPRSGRSLRAPRCARSLPR